MGSFSDCGERVEVREVFSVNEWNTSGLVATNFGGFVLNWGCFDTPSFCQINLFKQVEITPALFMFKQVKSELAFTCLGGQCQVKILDSHMMVSSSNT